MNPEGRKDRGETLGAPKRSLGTSAKRPLLTMAISLGITLVFAVFSAISVVPPLRALFELIGSGEKTSADAFKESIQSILTPAQFFLGAITILSFAVFSVATAWLLVTLIRRASSQQVSQHQQL